MSNFIEIKSLEDELLFIRKSNIVSIADKIDKTLVAMETSDGVAKFFVSNLYDDVKAMLND